MSISNERFLEKVLRRSLESCTNAIEDAYDAISYEPDKEHINEIVAEFKSRLERRFVIKAKEQ